MTVPQAFALALEHHRSGRLAEAEVLYRQILATQPNHADALHLLGVVAHQAGRDDLAREWISRAIQLQPNRADFRISHGNSLCNQGHHDAAIAEYRRALALEPNRPEAHTNLGIALAEAGQLDEAIDAYHHALRFNPILAETHINLGNALKKRRRLDEALAAYRRAIELNPKHADAHNGLGAALADQGDLDGAVAAFQQALQLQPNLVKGCFNLGSALQNLGRLEEAAAAYRRAIEIQPNFPEAQNNLGTVFKELAQLDEAVIAYRRALDLQPNSPETLNNLGATLMLQGRLGEAIAACRQALEQQPDHFGIHSNLVYALHFDPNLDETAITAEQRRWNEQVNKSAKPPASPQFNECDPERRLRIGYLSPDFRQHVIGQNLRPLFKQHDRQNFEIVCYSGVTSPDRITEEFRHRADLWRDTARLGDDSLAEMIRQDGVDILVDLTQHLAGNRLPVFARRPAPVPVSFAGYPASTGVEAIEYRISDRWLEADASKIEDGISEIGWRSGAELRSPNSDLRPAERVYLIDSFWCYEPYGFKIEAGAVPATHQGWLTFGSLNSFCKMNDHVLRLWARVLLATPGSRLVLLSGFGSHRQRTVEFLEREGLAPNRVEFVPPCAHRSYLELYQRLDIVLDPFPYDGHTTSLDALWMGVPVITLPGKRAVSRAALSILSNLGLPELIASSEEDYVKIATELAGDLPRLIELRRTLRSRLEASVLMDAPRFAANIESAYRAMWRQWCARTKS